MYKIYNPLINKIAYPSGPSHDVLTEIEITPLVTTEYRVPALRLHSTSWPVACVIVARHAVAQIYENNLIINSVIVAWKII